MMFRPSCGFTGPTPPLAELTLMAAPRFITATVATTLALAGCISYQPKDLNPATTLAAFDQRTLNEPGLQRFLTTHSQPAADDWDLARLTLASFYFSPELDIARGQLAEAEANVRAAEARPNPTFTFTPGYDVDAVAGVTPWIIGYALDVPFELGGKRAYRSAEARHRVEVAQFELARIAWARRSAVRQALIEMHAAEATAELWRTQKPLLTQAAQLVEAQVRAGEVSPLQAAQARIALNRAELAVRDSERALASSRSQLAEAIGIPLGALMEVRLAYVGLSSATDAIAPAEARRVATQNRADLLSALASYAAIQSALQLEIARQFPDLSFAPGYQFDQGEGKWSLGLGFTLPVFHQNQGPIAAAQARRETAAAQFSAVQNRVIGEVERALSDYTFALGDLETVKAMGTNLEQQARVIRAQQSAGETSRLDLARSQIELADNARAELEARVRTERALGALEDAMQRPIGFSEAVLRSSPRSAAN